MIVIPRRRSLAVAALVLATALAFATSAALAQEEEPQPVQVDTTGSRLMLTWNAPFGAPRASESLASACGDTSACDTLYLCFVPGMDSPTFNGFSADLRFRPVVPDTLDSFWRAVTKRGELRRFEVVFAPDSMFDVPSPFEVQGFGQSLTGIDAGDARVRMIYAVAANRAVPVRRGRTYVLAQVLVHHPPRRGAACRQALCVEWVNGQLGMTMGYEPKTDRGQRFVALRGQVERACATWRDARTRAWQRTQSRP